MSTKSSAPSSSDGVVHTWRVAHTMWIEIDRPGALNAINFEVMDGLYEALIEAERDEQVRAIILRGAGERSFISGGDLKAFSDLTSEADAEMMARRMREVLDMLERLPCWTIACINGAAYGGGCETLVACDFRVATTHARLGWTQARFALPCGWGGLTRLVELVGRGRAMRWLGTQHILNADQAKKEGLIDEVYLNHDFVERVQSFAHDLTHQPRHVIAALKHGAQRAVAMPRGEAMEAELAPFAACWAHDDHLNAVNAFISRQNKESSTSS